MGRKTSVYLTDELDAQLRASKLPLAEVVRRGLIHQDREPVDEHTLSRVLDEKLARLQATTCRAQTSHSNSTYETEPYLQDP